MSERTQNLLGDLRRGLLRFGWRARHNFLENTRFVNRRQMTRLASTRTLVWEYPLLLALSVVLVSLIVLDHPVAAFRGAYHPLAMEFASWTTHLGKSDWILIPSGTLALLSLLVAREGLDLRRKLLLANWSAVTTFVFAAVGVSGLIATLLKRIIGRARPEHLDPLGIAGFEHFALDASFASFPSGHSTTIGALAMVLALLVPTLRRVLLPAALLLGFTRVIVGAHFVSDVLTGLIFGAWFSYFTAVLFARRGLVFALDETGFPRIKPSFVLSPKRLGIGPLIDDAPRWGNAGREFAWGLVPRSARDLLMWERRSRGTQASNEQRA